LYRLEACNLAVEEEGDELLQLDCNLATEEEEDNFASLGRWFSAADVM
jgi:hypothetical protein